MNTTTDFNIIIQFCEFREREQDDDHYYYLCSSQDCLCKERNCPFTVGFQLPDWFGADEYEAHT